MVMSYKNASMVFQKVMNKMLRRKNTVVVTEAINEAWGDIIPEEIITDDERSYAV
jgi:hypothetical protein